MQININKKDVELTDKEEVKIFRKFSDLTKILKRFDPDEKTADVRVEKGARWGYKISFSMWLLKKKHIFAEVKGKDFKNAVNELKDLVVRQITDYKEKLSENRADKNKLLEKLR